MKDDNVYIKNDNGVFEPIGIKYDYLPDGIWYVRHHNGFHSRTNVGYLEGLYKLGGDIFNDIPQLCSFQDYTDYILDSKEFNDILNNKKGYSLVELVSACVGLVFKKNKNIRTRRKK